MAASIADLASREAHSGIGEDRIYCANVVRSILGDWKQAPYWKCFTCSRFQKANKVEIWQTCESCGVANPYLTKDVVSLASEAYYNRKNGLIDNATLRVLADALTDAQCKEELVCLRCSGTGIGKTSKAKKPTACRFCFGKGKVENALIRSLRSEGDKYLGFWPIDFIMGRK